MVSKYASQASARFQAMGKEALAEAVRDTVTQAIEGFSADAVARNPKLRGTVRHFCIMCGRWFVTNESMIHHIQTAHPE